MAPSSARPSEPSKAGPGSTRRHDCTDCGKQVLVPTNRMQRPGRRRQHWLPGRGLPKHSSILELRQVLCARKQRAQQSSTAPRPTHPFPFLAFTPHTIGHPPSAPSMHSAPAHPPPCFHFPARVPAGAQRCRHAAWSQPPCSRACIVHATVLYARTHAVRGGMRTVRCLIGSTAHRTAPAPYPVIASVCRPALHQHTPSTASAPSFLRASAVMSLHSTTPIAHLCWSHANAWVHRGNVHMPPPPALVAPGAWRKRIRGCPHSAAMLLCDTVHPWCYQRPVVTRLPSSHS
jgi:hypothetical protein